MKIVAITSCIAGLAHTPMAAKALEQAASKMGHEIKVEQQGAMGRVNTITKKKHKMRTLYL
ncbi:PTS system, Lactose/Cellobiose specific IIB subunit [Clostridioides difficile Y247]|uniref:PTS fructose transporter subunit IIB n=1 Tax=Clostridioides difficile TaxID=1496 RepID=UPI00038D7A4C|nr:PTS system, Lactose/Cellobiose specific IIB subunit [Clostridioides difficile]EQI45633.1 PTS system, Lactose/Cellobiose specific IIB subunit [Clostridioides difficile Y247]